MEEEEKREEVREGGRASEGASECPVFCHFWPSQRLYSERPQAGFLNSIWRYTVLLTITGTHEVQVHHVEYLLKHFFHYCRVAVFADQGCTPKI